MMPGDRQLWGTKVGTIKTHPFVSRNYWAWISVKENEVNC